jgi:C-terminal processing protease CtpA/Prc
MIAKYFTADKIVVGKEVQRNGPKHTDFSETEDFTLSPADSLVYQKPVVVLTNRLCYSATTFFSQAMRELPTVTLLGDTTGGGGGAPSGTELANGWGIRASNTRLLTPAGLDVEGGVPPDTVVTLRKEDADAGFDTLIEEALKRIRR